MSDALDAAESLKEKGISVEVVDPVTVKPFDEELIWREAQDKKLVVTYENHSVINGIGSAVADVLARHGAGVPLLKIGVNDGIWTGRHSGFTENRIQAHKQRCGKRNPGCPIQINIHGQTAKNRSGPGNDMPGPDGFWSLSLTERLC